jgi:hypothetical protein
LTSKRAPNEMERYLAANASQSKETLPHRQDILELWQILEPQYPTVARMAKDILAIPLHGVGVERNFNLGRDTCTYRRGHLHADTIKKIMELKHAHQKELVDEVLLSKSALKREMMQDIEIIAREESKKHAVSAEDQLARSCHFDHHEAVKEKKKKELKTGKGKK